MKNASVSRAYNAERGNPPYGKIRHYFFDMGNDGLLAFFEYPKGVAQSDRDALGGMQHVAFHADRATFPPGRVRGLVYFEADLIAFHSKREAANSGVLGISRPS